ncbi:Retinol dehydrogenase 12, partial [Tetrabaena socialis]
MATAASPPASFSLGSKPTGPPSLLQLPGRVLRYLVSPGSGEGLLSLLPGPVRNLLPGWDPDRDMPDMFGKVVLVTGANSGIGFQTSRLLARNNAHVVMVVRDEDKGRRAVEDIKQEFTHAKLTMLQADMASLRSVRALADRLLASSSPLHVLINNAGVLAPGPFALTEEGIETTLATNFYGPLYLTLLLLPRLRASAPSRVVNVASFGEMFGSVHWDDLRGINMGSSGLAAYAASKLYLIMASRDLNRRLRGTGVDIFPVHPGLVSTPGEAKSDKRYFISIADFVSSRLHGQSELRGALAPLFAATEPRL